MARYDKQGCQQSMDRTNTLMPNHKLDHRPFPAPPGTTITLGDDDPRHSAELEHEKDVRRHGI